MVRLKFGRQRQFQQQENSQLLSGQFLICWPCRKEVEYTLFAADQLPDPADRQRLSRSLVIQAVDLPPASYDCTAAF